MNNILKDLDLLVADTNRKNSNSPKFSRHASVYRLGQEIKVTDAGLVYSRKTKTGRVMAVALQGFKGVILDSVFRFELWTRANNKPEFKDSTTSHENPDGTRGNGTWPFPLSTATIIDKYKPSCKSGLSLEEALATYTNEEGRSDMSQKGYAYMLVTELDTGELDPKTEEPLGLKAVEPFIAHLPLSGTYAQMAFTRFVSDVAKAPEGLNDFKKTLVMVEAIPHPKMPSKSIPKLTPVGQAEDELNTKGLNLLEASLAEAKSAEEARLAEWKAKREASK